MCVKNKFYATLKLYSFFLWYAKNGLFGNRALQILPNRGFFDLVYRFNAIWLRGFLRALCEKRFSGMGN